MSPSPVMVGLLGKEELKLSLILGLWQSKNSGRSFLMTLSLRNSLVLEKIQSNFSCAWCLIFKYNFIVYYGAHIEVHIETPEENYTRIWNGKLGFKKYLDTRWIFLKDKSGPGEEIVINVSVLCNGVEVCRSMQSVMLEYEYTKDIQDSSKISQHAVFIGDVVKILMLDDDSDARTQATSSGATSSGYFSGFKDVVKILTPDDDSDARTQATGSGATSSGYFSGSKDQERQNFHKSREEIENWNEKQKFEVLKSAVVNWDELERNWGYVAEQEIGVAGGVKSLHSSSCSFQEGTVTKSGTVTLRISYGFWYTLKLPQHSYPATMPLEMSVKNTNLLKDVTIKLATWFRSVSVAKPINADVYRLRSHDEWQFFKKAELNQSGTISFTTKEPGQYVAAIHDSYVAGTAISVESTLFKHATGNLATNHHVSCDQMRDLAMREREDQGYVQIGQTAVTWVKPDDSVTVEVESVKEDLYTFTTDETPEIDPSLFKDLQVKSFEFSLQKKGEYSCSLSFNFKVGDQNQILTIEMEEIADEIEFHRTEDQECSTDSESSGVDEFYLAEDEKCSTDSESSCVDEFYLAEDGKCSTDSESSGVDESQPVNNQETLLDRIEPLHATMTVPREGGEISCGDCSIFFPYGALANPTDVSITLLDGSHHWPDGFAGAFSLIRCEPSGLDLAFAATIKVRTWYTRARGLIEEMHIFTRDGEATDWKKIDRLAPDQREVKFESLHFTDFVIAIAFRKGLNYLRLWMHHLRPLVFHNNNGDIAFGLHTDDNGKVEKLEATLEKKGYQATFPLLSAFKTSMYQTVSMEIACKHDDIAVALDPSERAEVKVGNECIKKIKHCSMKQVKYGERLMIGYTIGIPGQTPERNAIGVTLEKGEDIPAIPAKRSRRSEPPPEAEVTSSERGVSSTTSEQPQQPSTSLSLNISIAGNHIEKSTVANLLTGQSSLSIEGETTAASNSTIKGNQTSTAKQQTEHLQPPSSSSPGTSSRENPQAHRKPLGNQIPGNAYGTYVGANARATLHKHGGQEIVASGCDIARGQKLDARYCQGGEERNAPAGEEKFNKR